MNSYAQLCIVIHTYHYIFELLKAYCTLKVGRWSPEGTEKGSLLEVNSTF